MMAAVIASGAAICKLRKMKRTALRRQELEKLLVCGIAENAGIFDGLYESLYQSVLKPELDNRDGYLEWCGRVRHLESQDRFRTAFLSELDIGENAGIATYQVTAKHLLELIGKAGIYRSQEQELKTSARVLRDYLYLASSVPVDGTVCTVFKPAWYHDGKLVEQGMLMPKEMGV